MVPRRVAPVPMISPNYDEGAPGPSPLGTGVGGCMKDKRIPLLHSKTCYLYDRVGKETITSFSCDTSTNGFTLFNGYVLGSGGRQMTEYGASVAQPLHTNVWAAGQLISVAAGIPERRTFVGREFIGSAPGVDWIRCRQCAGDCAGSRGHRRRLRFGTAVRSDSYRTSWSNPGTTISIDAKSPIYVSSPSEGWERDLPGNQPVAAKPMGSLNSSRLSDGIQVS